MNCVDRGGIFSLYFLSGNSLVEEDLLVVFVMEGGNDGGQDILGIVLFKVGILDGFGFGLSPNLKIGVVGVGGI